MKKEFGSQKTTNKDETIDDIRNRIDVIGVYFEDHLGTIFSARECPCQPGYFISYHKGEMPSFKTESFNTIEDVIAAMQTIAPLEKWKDRTLE